MQNSTTTNAAPVNPAPLDTSADELATPAGFRWADFDAARAARLTGDQVYDFATRSCRSEVGA